MGLEPILPVRLPVTIDTMLNCDGDGVGTCKQALTLKRSKVPFTKMATVRVNEALERPTLLILTRTLVIEHVVNRIQGLSLDY